MLGGIFPNKPRLTGHTLMVLKIYALKAEGPPRTKVNLAKQLLIWRQP